MLKASNLRDMPVEELEAMVIAVSKELYELVNELNRTKKLVKVHLLRQKRKEKARLLTILHEKRMLT